MFLLVPAYPGCPGSKAVKRSLLLLLYDATLVWVLAVALSLPVSVTSQCSVEGDGRSSRFLDMDAFLSYPILCYKEIFVPDKRPLNGYCCCCYKEIRVSTKVRVLPSKTLS